MKTLPKVLLGLAGGCAVLIVALVAMGAWFWHRHGKGLIADGKVAVEKGEQRGASLDENACLTEAIEARRNANFMRLLLVNMELQGCLNTSRLSPDFCAGVPGPNQVIQVGIWSVKRCEELKVQDSQCTSLAQELVRYCGSPERKRKLADTGAS